MQTLDSTDATFLNVKRGNKGTSAGCGTLHHGLLIVPRTHTATVSYRGFVYLGPSDGIAFLKSVTHAPKFVPSLALQAPEVCII